MDTSHVFGCDEKPLWLAQLEPSTVCELATAGSARELTNLMRVGGQPTAKDANGQPALLLACKHAPEEKRAATVAALLTARADPNAFDTERCTPLLAASFGGCHESVRLLIEAGALSDWHSLAGFTALHAACQMNKPSIVNLLLATGKAPIDATTKSGGTPLAVACMVGAADCVAALLDRGASVNGVKTGGPAPLFLAALHSWPACVSRMLQARADVSRTSYGKTALEAAEDERCKTLLLDEQGRAAVAADAAAAALLAEEEQAEGGAGSGSGKKRSKKKNKGRAKAGACACGTTDSGGIGGGGGSSSSTGSLLQVAASALEGCLAEPAPAVVAEEAPSPPAHPQSTSTSAPAAERLATTLEQLAIAPSEASARRGSASSESSAEALLQCVICLEAPKSRACVPCGHVCACERCAAPLTSCPICREPCTDIMRIYLS